MTLGNFTSLCSDSAGICAESVRALSKPSFSFEKLAPEAGLEPATPRLTAACSTIELLWNPNGRAIYKPLFAASNRFCRAQTCWRSRSLAVRAKKRAARPLHDAFDGRAATRTRPPFPVVNPQSLLV